MSRHNERDPAYQHELDTEYEVWRSGYNPDMVDRDRVRDQFYEGFSPEESASDSISRFPQRSWIEVEPIDDEPFV